MHETPSQAIIKKQSVTVVDARGRKIEVRKLKTLERMQLIELVGAANSENERYLSFAMLAYSVTSIDGEPTGRPSSKLALETIVAELDDDGFDAVGKVFSENFTDGVGGDAREAIKNA